MKTPILYFLIAALTVVLAIRLLDERAANREAYTPPPVNLDAGLSNFIVKSSYNSCLAPSFSSYDVSVKQLEKVLRANYRAVDLELIGVPADDGTVGIFVTAGNFYGDESGESSVGKIPFTAAIETIVKVGLTKAAGGIEHPEHPLFLFLRPRVPAGTAITPEAYFEEIYKVITTPTKLDGTGVRLADFMRTGLGLATDKVSAMAGTKNCFLAVDMSLFKGDIINKFYASKLRAAANFYVPNSIKVIFWDQTVGRAAVGGLRPQRASDAKVSLRTLQMSIPRNGARAADANYFGVGNLDAVDTITEYGTQFFFVSAHRADQNLAEYEKLFAAGEGFARMSRVLERFPNAGKHRNGDDNSAAGSYMIINLIKLGFVILVLAIVLMVRFMDGGNAAPIFSFSSSRNTSEPPPIAAPKRNSSSWSFSSGPSTGVGAFAVASTMPNLGIGNAAGAAASGVGSFVGEMFGFH